MRNKQEYVLSAVETAQETLLSLVGGGLQLKAAMQDDLTDPSTRSVYIAGTLFQAMQFSIWLLKIWKQASYRDLNERVQNISIAVAWVLENRDNTPASLQVKMQEYQNILNTYRQSPNDRILHVSIEKIARFRNGVMVVEFLLFLLPIVFMATAFSKDKETNVFVFAASVCSFLYILVNLIDVFWLSAQLNVWNNRLEKLNTDLLNSPVYHHLFLSKKFAEWFDEWFTKTGVASRVVSDSQSHDVDLQKIANLRTVLNDGNIILRTAIAESSAKALEKRYNDYLHSHDEADLRILLINIDELSRSFVENGLHVATRPFPTPDANLRREHPLYIQRELFNFLQNIPPLFQQAILLLQNAWQNRTLP